MACDSIVGSNHDFTLKRDKWLSSVLIFIKSVETRSADGRDRRGQRGMPTS